MSAKSLAFAAVQDLKAARQQEKPEAQTGPAAEIDNALTVLLSYIPTEATAIYLALGSSLPAIQANVPGLQSIYVYWAFVVFVNPLLFVLVYYNQLARNNQDFPSLAEFPYWRLLASFIAFAVWALCVPNNPYSSEKPGLGVLFGVIAVFVAILLPLIQGIAERKKKRDPL
jgi:hypothetical protein